MDNNNKSQVICIDLVDDDDDDNDDNKKIKKDQDKVPPKPGDSDSNYYVVVAFVDQKEINHNNNNNHTDKPDSIVIDLSDDDDDPKPQSRDIKPNVSLPKTKLPKLEPKVPKQELKSPQPEPKERPVITEESETTETQDEVVVLVDDSDGETDLSQNLLEEVFYEDEDQLKKTTGTVKYQEHLFYECEECHNIYIQEDHLEQHFNAVHEKSKKSEKLEFSCMHCTRSFRTELTMSRHEKECEMEVKKKCSKLPSKRGKKRKNSDS